MTKRILVAGLDGSFAHFGVATAWLDLETLELEPMEFKVIHTEKSKIKTVRSSSDNLRRAVELMAIIGAGIKTPSFKQTLAILRQNAQLLQAA